ncbi:DUF4190 domain-containing protein [Nocardia sp. NPDC051030]|uniref:DUF4190 domain-containing protein n=1 Tax=Nocardia sp. NPDC051030 TaxID=3155162 RepID=UPI00341DE8F1
MSYPPYGYPGYPVYGNPPPPEHPQATTIMVLGILSLVLCQLLGPVAWIMGSKARKEIDASGGMLGGRSNVTVGYVCGIVGTCILIAIPVIWGLMFLFIAILGANSSSSY